MKNIRIPSFTAAKEAAALMAFLIFSSTAAFCSNAAACETSYQDISIQPTWKGNPRLTSVGVYAVTQSIHHCFSSGYNDCGAGTATAIPQYTPVPFRLDETDQRILIPAGTINACAEDRPGIIVVLNRKPLFTYGLLGQLPAPEKGLEFAAKDIDEAVVKFTVENLSSPIARTVELKAMPSIHGRVVVDMFHTMGVEDPESRTATNLTMYYEGTLSSAETQCLASLAKEGKSATVYGEFVRSLSNRPNAPDDFRPRQLSDEALAACGRGK